MQTHSLLFTFHISVSASLFSSNYFIISIIQEAKKFHLFAIQSTRFGLDVLGEPPALSAPRHRPSAFGQRREGDLEEVVHALDVLHEEVKLQLEYLQSVLQHRTKVRFAEGDQVQLEKNINIPINE